MALNLEGNTNGLFVSLQDVHKACEKVIQTKTPTPETLGKLIRRLYDVESMCSRVTKGDKGIILFKNLSPRTVTSQDKTVRLPSMCKVAETVRFFGFTCPLPYIRNSEQLNCLVGFEPNNFWIQVDGKKLSTSFAVPLTQTNVDGIVHLISNLNLCKGFRKDDDYFPKTFNEEKFSASHETDQTSMMRSHYCNVFLEWFAKQDACPSCNISRVRNHRKRKNPDCCTGEESESKETVTVTTQLEHTQKKDSPVKKRAWREVDQNIHLGKSTHPKDSNKDCESNSNLVSKENVEEIVLNSDDQEDMEKLINVVLQQEGLPENFGLLLRSQLQNCARPDLEKHQRRWDPKIISLCLTLYIRSPQAYEDLKKSNFLQLPSKRLLRYYKNSVKQSPGFCEDNLLWMKKEMDKQNVPEFGRHGGLIVDEMTIQDDLIITKSGDTWNLVGFVDMGSTNNNIDIICKGKKERKLATHVIQFVFHGLTGFR